MPGPKQITRRRSTQSTGRSRAPAAPSHALLVIDHGRLQNAAWAELHTVRKQLEKATRELHRHEEVDVPAYEAWLSRTFPLQVTALRELNEEVIAKIRQIRTVQAIAAHTGRSAKRLWREQKERAANPEAARAKSRPEHDAEAADEESSERRKDARPEDFEPRPAPHRSTAARDIYRRLVQYLHPDRGGAWTTARQNLWHEVQQAWATGDADWLARLESEWETAHASVGPTSPLSRLRAAIEELHAARRDIEHKLAEYRTALSWRFTLTLSRRAALERRVEAEFGHEVKMLRRQLEYLNRTIAAWEEDWTRADARLQPRPRRTGFQRRRRGPGPNRGPAN